MSITCSRRIVTVVAWALLAAGVQGLASPPGAGTAAGHVVDVAGPQDVTSATAQAATVRYWTPARMAAVLRRPVKPSARPERHLVKKAVPKPSVRPLARSAPWVIGNTTGEGLRWTHGGTVADAVGKVFFTLGGEDYVCSGTLVGGKQADVVLTAAHCVTSGPLAGGRTEWATNWMFVPGFRDGRMPFGEYTARGFFVTHAWTGPASGSEQYDVAFVRVSAGTPYGESAAPSPPPGLPIEFTGSQDAVPASQAYVFGYPSLAPYTGLYPSYCAGLVAAAGGSARTTCRMTAGDSGGPWLAGFSPLSGSGKVVAVSTYKVSSNLSVLYGAVLGPQARSLYERAVSSAR